MKRILSVLLIMYSSITFGMQTKQVIDGQTVQGDISQTELTRIYVLADRIKDIKSAANDFILEKDEDNGQIFIMPHPGKHNPITLFVTTELGKTIALSLKPVDLQAQTLQLVMSTSPNDKVTEKNHSYESNIFQLVKAMKNKEPVFGYSIEKITSEQTIENGLAKRDLMIYQGKLKGKIINIENKTDTLMSINEEDMKDSEIKAIALLKHSLMPSESTEAYIVYGS